MQVTIRNPKTNLSKLIEAAKAGEEAVIAKGTVPVARVVALPQNKFTIGLTAALERWQNKGLDFRGSVKAGRFLCSSQGSSRTKSLD
jgi:antitoxin (DNA-binding transcriptional repressor) of toxin-antitoxin stability system